MVSREEYYGRARILDLPSVSLMLPQAVARHWILNNTSGGLLNVGLGVANNLKFIRAGS